VAAACEIITLTLCAHCCCTLGLTALLLQAVKKQNKEVKRINKLTATWPPPPRQSTGDSPPSTVGTNDSSSSPTTEDRARAVSSESVMSKSVSKDVAAQPLAQLLPKRSSATAAAPLQVRTSSITSGTSSSGSGSTGRGYVATAKQQSFEDKLSSSSSGHNRSISEVAPSSTLPSETTAEYHTVVRSSTDAVPADYNTTNNNNTSSSELPQHSQGSSSDADVSEWGQESSYGESPFCVCVCGASHSIYTVNFVACFLFPRLQAYFTEHAAAVLVLQVFYRFHCLHSACMLAAPWRVTSCRAL
jgi:hypothetical protein